MLGNQSFERLPLHLLGPVERPFGAQRAEDARIEEVHLLVGYGGALGAFAKDRQPKGQQQIFEDAEVARDDFALDVAFPGHFSPQGCHESIEARDANPPQTHDPGPCAGLASLVRSGINVRYHCIVKRRHRKTLVSIFRHPTSGSIPWRDIEALFIELGAEVSERAGSRVGVRHFGDRRVFHRPHPGPKTDKGAVASVREWLKRNGVEP